MTYSSVGAENCMSQSKTRIALRGRALGEAGTSNASNSCRVHPLGEVFAQDGAPVGFCAQDLMAGAAECVPAWQRDAGENPSATQAASTQRTAILSALTKTGRCGVILDPHGAVTQGTVGWMQHINAMPTVTLKQNRLSPTSVQSRQELVAALDLLFCDDSCPGAPVALRDLDGWVTEIIHLKRVGVSNPERAFIVLPKSPTDFENTLSTLSLGLGLTPLETTLVGLITKGQTEWEMATALALKSNDIRSGIRQLLLKFAVRQRSDIARLVASFS